MEHQLSQRSYKVTLHQTDNKSYGIVLKTLSYISVVLFTVDSGEIKHKHHNTPSE